MSQLGGEGEPPADGSLQGRGGLRLKKNRKALNI